MVELEPSGELTLLGGKNRIKKIVSKDKHGNITKIWELEKGIELSDQIAIFEALMRKISQEHGNTLSTQDIILTALNQIRMARENGNLLVALSTPYPIIYAQGTNPQNASGSNVVHNEPTPPTPTLADMPINPSHVRVGSGNSGAGPQPAASRTITAPNLSNPAPIPASAVYSPPRTMQQAFNYAVDYIRKNNSGIDDATLTKEADKWAKTYCEKNGIPTKVRKSVLLNYDKVRIL